MLTVTNLCQYVASLETVKLCRPKILETDYPSQHKVRSTSTTLSLAYMHLQTETNPSLNFAGCFPNNFIPNNLEVEK